MKKTLVWDQDVVSSDDSMVIESSFTYTHASWLIQATFLAEVIMIITKLILMILSMSNKISGEHLQAVSSL